MSELSVAEQILYAEPTFVGMAGAALIHGEDPLLRLCMCTFAIRSPPLHFLCTQVCSGVFCWAITNGASFISSANSCAARKRTMREARCIATPKMVHLLLHAVTLFAYHPHARTHAFDTDPMLAMFGPLGEVSIFTK